MTQKNKNAYTNSYYDPKNSNPRPKNIKFKNKIDFFLSNASGVCNRPLHGTKPSEVYELRKGTSLYVSYFVRKKYILPIL